MEEFLIFIAGLSTAQKGIWLFAWVSMGLFFEQIFPFSIKDYHKVKHNLVNLTFLAITMIINTLFTLFIVNILCPFIESNQIGLLYLIELPTWAELLIALLFFDFSAQFFIHLLLHKIKPIWRFHMIHHSDTMVVATSGTRHHPLDYLTRELFSLLVILVTGAPFSYYMVYRIITIPCTYFTHANINLPLWLDKTLSYLIVTPNVHRFHHHYQLPFTDSNYGNILSIWDRLFGTFRYDDPGMIKFGIDILEGKNDEDILFQLGVPFNKKIPSTVVVKSKS